MNRPMDAQRLLCELQAHDKAEEARDRDGVLTEEEQQESRQGRTLLMLLARRVWLNERHVIQTLRIGFDETPDHNLIPAINEYDCLVEQAKSPNGLVPIEAFDKAA